MPTMRVRTRSLAAAGLATAALAVAPAVAGADGFPLVGWWPMNEGSGQVVHDWSGHGNNGTLGNSSGVDSQDPSWIPGVFFGSALRFDGNDIVQIPDSTTLDPQKITVSAWFRGTTSPGINKYVISKGSVQCDHASYGLYTSSTGGMAFYVSDSSTWHRSPEAPASVWDGKWHNAAGTYDGQTVRLFIDGNEVGNGTPNTAPIAYNPPNGGGLIGDYHGADGGVDCDLFLTGDVDGLQIWSQPLPVADIWRFFKTLLTASR
jgi:Concanavalin A-like lectin/glucanases superfamily